MRDVIGSVAHGLDPEYVGFGWSVVHLLVEWLFSCMLVLLLSARISRWTDFGILMLLNYLQVMLLFDDGRPDLLNIVGWLYIAAVILKVWYWLGFSTVNFVCVNI